MLTKITTATTTRRRTSQSSPRPARLLPGKKKPSSFHFPKQQSKLEQNVANELAMAFFCNFFANCGYKPQLGLHHSEFPRTLKVHVEEQSVQFIYFFGVHHAISPCLSVEKNVKCIKPIYSSFLVGRRVVGESKKKVEI